MTVMSHSGGVRPATVRRPSGFKAAYLFRRRFLPWTIFTNGLDGLIRYRRLGGLLRLTFLNPPSLDRWCSNTGQHSVDLTVAEGIVGVPGPPDGGYPWTYIASRCNPARSISSNCPRSRRMRPSRENVRSVRPTTSRTVPICAAISCWSCRKEVRRCRLVKASNVPSGRAPSAGPGPRWRRSGDAPGWPTDRVRPQHVGMAAQQVAENIGRDGIDYSGRQRRYRRQVLSTVHRRGQVKTLARAESVQHVFSPLLRQALDCVLGLARRKRPLAWVPRPTQGPGRRQRFAGVRARRTLDARLVQARREKSFGAKHQPTYS